MFPIFRHTHIVNINTYGSERAKNRLRMNSDLDQPRLSICIIRDSEIRQLKMCLKIWIPWFSEFSVQLFTVPHHVSRKFPLGWTLSSNFMPKARLGTAQILAIDLWGKWSQMQSGCTSLCQLLKIHYLLVLTIPYHLPATYANLRVVKKW